MLARSAYEHRTNIFMNSTPSKYQLLPPSVGSDSTHYYADLSQTHRAETDRHVAAEQYNHVLWEVVAMEVKMDISTCWQPADVQYIQTVNVISWNSDRNYNIFQSSELEL
jgi:hypothetical protein